MRYKSLSTSPHPHIRKEDVKEEITIRTSTTVVSIVLISILAQPTERLVSVGITAVILVVHKYCKNSMIQLSRVDYLWSRIVQILYSSAFLGAFPCRNPFTTGGACLSYGTPPLFLPSNKFVQGTLQHMLTGGLAPAFTR